jgi:hypothetical protein
MPRVPDYKEYCNKWIDYLHISGCYCRNMSNHCIHKTDPSKLVMIEAVMGYNYKTHKYILLSQNTLLQLLNLDLL